MVLHIQAFIKTHTYVYGNLVRCAQGSLVSTHWLQVSQLAQYEVVNIQYKHLFLLIMKLQMLINN